VRMNLTGRVGHDCAASGAAATSGVSNAASMKVQVRRRAPSIGPPIGCCDETTRQSAAKDMRQKLAPADNKVFQSRIPTRCLLMAPGPGAFTAVLHRLAAERAEADGML